MSNEKILIVSHGHPDISKGGAEVAAYNLYQEYKNRGIDCLFLARTDRPAHGGSTFSTRNGGEEVLFHTHMGDFFLFQNGYKKHVWQDFKSLLEQYQPTVVHFHHYIHMGLELIKQVKNSLPDTKIILTLHEYLAICANNGQMVKPGGQMKLCYKSTPSDCASCFPDKSASDFFLREKYIKSVFEQVDHFVSPSHFLIDRYKAWGIEEEKMTMIENGQPQVEFLPPRPLAKDEPRGKFAFFGQVNPFKGIDILLEAFRALPEDVREQVHLDIHGANLESQTSEFKDKVAELLEELEGTVTMHGSYESHEMGQLLAQTDWVIIPSNWWENSPMVIQEAYKHGRPLIGSDIGGMAEKIVDGETGILFRARNYVDLAKKIEDIVEDSSNWELFVENIQVPLTIEECADIHLGEVY
ncbi:glycosyltransferase [Vibrio astriarenae]|uniref:Glycosyltransferase n=1 Tax=Vibrio astriarenae TaxID=1481923 RepID=A0A7Z2YEI0_9VIBR|nr:glycosyltransferase family 4 protein [Vibrio astriarenae]QIA64457.1 glycosyltransferase [Vibrio astriarenae]